MRFPRIASFLLVAIYLCLVAQVSHAQDVTPVHPVDGEYIKEWLVLGPFFPNDLEKDFLADVGGEVNVDPKKGDTVTTAEGKTLTWKRYTSGTNTVNLTSFSVSDTRFLNR